MRNYQFQYPVLFTCPALISLHRAFESHLTAKQLDGKFGKSHTVSKISKFRLDMDNKMPANERIQDASALD